MDGIKIIESKTAEGLELNVEQALKILKADKNKIMDIQYSTVYVARSGVTEGYVLYSAMISYGK